MVQQAKDVRASPRLRPEVDLRQKIHQEADLTQRVPQEEGLRRKTLRREFEQTQRHLPEADLRRKTRRGASLDHLLACRKARALLLIKQNFNDTEALQRMRKLYHLLGVCQKREARLLRNLVPHQRVPRIRRFLRLHRDLGEERKLQQRQVSKVVTTSVFFSRKNCN